MGNSLGNISVYAAGRRAAIDEAVDGKPAEKAQPSKEPAKPEKDDHNKEHKATIADKIKRLFSEQQAPASDTRVASTVPGMEAVRDALGPDARHISDGQIIDSLGKDIVAQIGEKGFPHAEVQSIQQGFEEHKLDTLEALQTYVASVNSAPGDKLQLMDEKGGQVNLDTDKVLQVAGIDRAEIAQVRAREDGPQQDVASSSVTQQREKTSEREMA